MKSFFVILAFLLLSIFLLRLSTYAFTDVEKIEITASAQFGKRPSTPVYFPKDISKKLPLVISLHGHMAQGRIQDLYFQFKKEVNEEQFVLAIPTGTNDIGGHHFWNDTILNLGFLRGHNDDDPAAKVNDIGFIDELIEQIAEKTQIDFDRIFLIGHSNGGFMSYAYACKGKYRIKKIAILAGGITRQLHCNRHFSILHIHGTEDGIVQYDGNIPYFFSVEENLNFWKNLNQCTHESQDLENFDLTLRPGKETTRTRWPQCQSAKTVELWTIQNGWHIPLINSNFRKEVLKSFFSN